MLEVSDVRKVIIKEHWCEYAVKHAYPQIKDFADVSKHLPDEIDKGADPGREWFWNVINTLIPNWVKEY